MIAAPLIVQLLRSPVSVLGFTLQQWDLVIRQARRANLLARVHHVLQQEQLLARVPHAPSQHLEWARIAADRHAQAVRTEVARIQNAVMGQPVILLKGAAYAMAGLAPASGRIFSDIDILVPRADLPAVESALMLHGWITTHHDAYDQRYYREWMHELPPLQHVVHQSVIDVHHAILPLTMAIHPDSAKLIAAAVPVAGHADLLVLAPVDMVLHSAAHLFYEGELHHGLRDLSDLDALLRSFSNTAGFWETLVPRARELELTRCLFYALRYTRLLLGTPIPADVVSQADAGRPGPVLRRLMDGFYLRSLLPVHHTCDDHLTPLARKSLYIRANGLRMPPLQLARHLFHKAFVSPKE